MASRSSVRSVRLSARQGIHRALTGLVERYGKRAAARRTTVSRPYNWKGTDMRKLTLTLTIAALGLAATPALAGDARIAWNDLDLTTPAGKAELGRRVDAAARKLCIRNSVTGSLIGRAPSKACLAEAHELIRTRLGARIGAERLAAAVGGGAEAR
jgi:UrcA family protein